MVTFEVDAATINLMYHVAVSKHDLEKGGVLTSSVKGSDPSVPKTCETVAVNEAPSSELLVSVWLTHHLIESD